MSSGAPVAPAVTVPRASPVATAGPATGAGLRAEATWGAGASTQGQARKRPASAGARSFGNRGSGSRHGLQQAAEKTGLVPGRDITVRAERPPAGHRGSASGDASPVSVPVPHTSASRHSSDKVITVLNSTQALAAAISASWREDVHREHSTRSRLHRPAEATSPEPHCIPDTTGTTLMLPHQHVDSPAVRGSPSHLDAVLEPGPASQVASPSPSLSAYRRHPPASSSSASLQPLCIPQAGLLVDLGTQCNRARASMACSPASDGDGTVRPEERVPPPQRLLASLEAQQAAPPAPGPAVPQALCTTLRLTTSHSGRGGCVRRGEGMSAASQDSLQSKQPALSVTTIRTSRSPSWTCQGPRVLRLRLSCYAAARAMARTPLTSVAAARGLPSHVACRPSLSCPQGQLPWFAHP